MTPLDQIEITNSERKSFSCRQRWLWRSVMRFREAKTGRALLNGTIIDRALDAYWLAGGGYGGIAAARAAIDKIGAERSEAIDELAMAFITQTQLAPTEAPDLSRAEFLEMVESAKAMIEAYHQHWTDAGRDWELISKARTIRGTFGGVTIAGEVDMIVRDRKTGRRLLVDHKTTKRPLSQWIPENTISPQMATYAGILADLGESVDGHVFDVIRIAPVVGLDGLPRNKDGAVRKYTAARLPPCTADTWRGYLSDVAIDNDGDIDADLLDVLRGLERREEAGHYFAEVVDTISPREVQRTRLELENIANEMRFLKQIAEPWVKVVDDAAEKGKLWLATQRAHEELAPAFPRNHSECFQWSRPCAYMGLCRYGQAGDSEFYRASTTSPELTPTTTEDEDV